MQRCEPTGGGAVAARLRQVAAQSRRPAVPSGRMSAGSGSWLASCLTDLSGGLRVEGARLRLARVDAPLGLGRARPSRRQVRRAWRAVRRRRDRHEVLGRVVRLGTGAGRQAATAACPSRLCLAVAVSRRTWARAHGARGAVARSRAGHLLIDASGGGLHSSGNSGQPAVGKKISVSQNPAVLFHSSGRRTDSNQDDRGRLTSSYAHCMYLHSSNAVVFPFLNFPTEPHRSARSESW